MKKKMLLALLLTLTMTTAPVLAEAELDPWEDETLEEWSDYGDADTPYAWEDEDGNVWYSDGEQEILIGTWDDYYVDDGILYENTDADWDSYEDWADDGYEYYGDDQYYDEVFSFDPTIVEVIGDEVNYYPYDYPGYFTVDAVEKALNQMTGMNYSVDLYQNDNGIVVSWKEDSTLFAGLPEDVTMDQLVFENEEQLQKSMLDTLAATLKYNFGFYNIWYCNENGAPLKLETLELGDLPYFGIKYYESYPGTAEKVENKEQAEKALEFILNDNLSMNAKLTFEKEQTVVGQNAYVFTLSGDEFSDTIALTESGMLCVQDQENGVFEVAAPYYNNEEPEENEMEAPYYYDDESEEYIEME